MSLCDSNRRRTTSATIVADTQIRIFVVICLVYTVHLHLPSFVSVGFFAYTNIPQFDAKVGHQSRRPIICSEKTDSRYQGLDSSSKVR